LEVQDRFPQLGGEILPDSDAPPIFLDSISDGSWWFGKA
jgi:hypothetical protein